MSNDHRDSPSSNNRRRLMQGMAALPLASLPMWAQAQASQFPTAKIIPYTELAPGTSDEKIAEVVKAKGCQGVIVGNAG